MSADNMDCQLDKSASDSEISTNKTVTTPKNYAIFTRFKRPREEEDHTLMQDMKNFKEEFMKKMLDLFSAQEKKLQSITDIQKEIRESNINAEKAISVLTTQNEEYRKQIAALEVRSKEDHVYIATLEDKIEDLQRDSRKTSIEIKNVPKKEGERTEDLIEMVKNLAKTIGCQMNTSDIKDVHRIHARKDQTPNMPIVVETGSTLLKSNLLKKCKEFNRGNQSKLRAKHLGFRTSEETPIYVSEQLTTKGARLFFLARDLAKTKSYKYCWTSFGKVLVRKDDSSPFVRVTSESQIQQLLQ